MAKLFGSIISKIKKAETDNEIIELFQSADRRYTKLTNDGVDFEVASAAYDEMKAIGWRQIETNRQKLMESLEHRRQQLAAEKKSARRVGGYEKELAIIAGR